MCKNEASKKQKQQLKRRQQQQNCEEYFIICETWKWGCAKRNVRCHFVWKISEILLNANEIYENYICCQENICEGAKWY